MMDKLIPIVCVLAAACARARADSTGTITGTVVKPPTAMRAAAIDRDSGKSYPGQVEAGSGHFRVSGLPLGKSYDLRLGKGDCWLEGIRLKVPRSDYEEEQPLTKEDIAKLTELTRSLNKFENKLEVLTVRGNIQHAAVLVNKMRTDAFINSAPGEMIWRLEMWHFERPDEHWVKVQDELFVVLHRERLQKSVFDKMCLTLDERLGGLEPTAARPAMDIARIEWPPAIPGVHLRATARH